MDSNLLRNELHPVLKKESKKTNEVGIVKIPTPVKQEVQPKIELFEK